MIDYLCFLFSVKLQILLKDKFYTEIINKSLFIIFKHKGRKLVPTFDNYLLLQMSPIALHSISVSTVVLKHEGENLIAPFGSVPAALWARPEQCSHPRRAKPLSLSRDVDSSGKVPSRLKRTMGRYFALSRLYIRTPSSLSSPAMNLLQRAFS